MPAVLDPLYLAIDLSRTTFDTILVDKTRRDLLDPYCPPSGICQTAKDVLRAGVWMLEGVLHGGMQTVHRLMGDATAQQLMRHNASTCTLVTQDWTTSLLAPPTIHEENTERLVITMALNKTIATRVGIELDAITVLLAKFIPRTSPIFKLDSVRRNNILLIAYFANMDNLICTERAEGICKLKTGKLTFEAICGVKVLQQLWRIMYGSLSMDCADGMQQRALIVRYTTILLELCNSARQTIDDDRGTRT